MFKLFKDLTRPPEPLQGGRSRSASLSTGVTAPAPPTPAPTPAAPKQGDSGDGADASGAEGHEEVRETDPNAILVAALVHSLVDVSGTMAYVEVRMPSTCPSAGIASWA